MTKPIKLTYDQLAAMVEHYQQVGRVQTDANNGLIARLHASKTFADADRTTLNEWSAITNGINEASDAHLLTIVGASAPSKMN